MSKVVIYPVIDQVATGSNIKRLRESKGFTVREVQRYFNFDLPQTIYYWEQGKFLPSLDHIFALAKLFDVSIEDILVEGTPNAPGTREPRRKLSCLLFMVA